MKKHILIILLFTISINHMFAQCNPVSASPTCTTAIPLTAGNACVNGTTCQGSAELPSSCLFMGSECSWYSFTATATDMFVSITLTTFSGCHISSNVYESTGPCTGLVEISCLFGTPLDDHHALTGLSIGSTYYIQVCYPPGGPCGNYGSAEYCIKVGTPDPPCDLCAIPCGTAAGYLSNPTVQQVVDDCITVPFVPELQPSSTYTFCYGLHATDVSVDFNVIITSDCGVGNVTNFSWELYNIPCGGVIQTGTLASLTFMPVVVGNQYVFCYTFDVPSTCTHSQHCPFFVGAETILLASNDIKLETNFESYRTKLSWTAEFNNDILYFDIGRSSDALFFESIGTVLGTNLPSYIFYDDNPNKELNYYRVKGYSEAYIFMSNLSVISNINKNDLLLYPMPVDDYLKISLEDLSIKHGNIKIFSQLGNLVYDKTFTENIAKIDMRNIYTGIYFISITNLDNKTSSKFIKIEKL